MTTFDTPEPITVTVELSVGDLRVVASDRTDTVVDVRPTNSTKRGDVSAAEQTRVEYADGNLLIKAPKGWRNFSILGGGDSIDVSVEVPAGSQLRGGAAVAAVRGVGRLGECNFKSSAGNIDLATAGPVRLKTSVGDITVEQVVGDADLATSSGTLRVAAVDGNAVIKNSNGGTRIGDITGDLRVSAANGGILVDRARATVVAKTANGDVRIGEVVGGAIQVDSARGRIDIGVADGVPAYLDLKTQFGNVRSDLEATAQPEAGERTVEVRARTAFGDITIKRAAAARSTD